MLTGQARTRRRRLLAARGGRWTTASPGRGVCGGRGASCSAAALVAVALAGCGQSVRDRLVQAERAREASTSTAANAPAPAATSPTGFTPTRTHTWTLVPDSQEMPPPGSGERIGQSNVQLSMALGDVMAATAPLPTSFQDLSSVCQVDPAHDAVLPLQVTLSNHGPVGLDATLEFAVSDLRIRIVGVTDPIPVEAASAFATDPSSCTPIGDSQEFANLEYANLAAGETVVHNYLLLLPSFYSANYDSNGNRYALRHMVGYIKFLRVFVTGDNPDNALPLDSVSCYTGPPHQGVDGPGLPGAGLVDPAAIGPPPAGVSPVLPDFVLAESGFDYRYGEASISQPSGYTPC